MQRWGKGQQVTMVHPLQPGKVLQRRGTVIAADCGFVLVWTSDGLTHLFEEPSGHLADSPDLGKKWVLR